MCHYLPPSTARTVLHEQPNKPTVGTFGNNRSSFFDILILDGFFKKLHQDGFLPVSSVVVVVVVVDFSASVLSFNHWQCVLLPATLQQSTPVLWVSVLTS